MPSTLKKEEAEWVAIKAAHTHWGDERAQHVDITCVDTAAFCGSVSEVQRVLEILLGTIVPGMPERKHFIIETTDYEVCFTIADSLLPITDEHAERKHGMTIDIPLLEYRWGAIRHADVVARRYGGYVTLRESNGHVAVTVHLMRSLPRERCFYA